MTWAASQLRRVPHWVGRPHEWLDANTPPDTLVEADAGVADVPRVAVADAAFGVAGFGEVAPHTLKTASPRIRS